MKLGLIESSLTLGALGAALSLVITACSSSNTAGAGLFDGDGGASSSSSGSSSGASSGGQADPPHALGVVSLAESHYSGASNSTPYVSASFVPDSADSTTCTTTIAGCTVPMVAKCDGLNGHPLCGEGQTCGLDSQCSSTCITACTAECPTGEECYFESSSSQGCRAVQSFNAGAIAFAGTTQPLTLFPPYTYSSTANGSLFLAGASLEVQGAGAAGAGFGAFDQKFTATSFLQTSPSLSTLTSSQVWGAGSIPVGWVAGSDSIVVSLSGELGSAQCQATDSTGQFQIPRAVVQAVVGTGTPTLTISVTREHQDWNKSLKTQGTLVAETVQPVAFLEVETSSTESYSFTGCAGGVGETMCSDGCVDLQTSATDCGSCGHVCPGTEYCSGGTCYGTTQNCGTLTSCSDGCQNLQTSLSDCGSCGNPCPGGDSCINGSCVGQSNTTCSSCETTAEEGTCATAYSNCSNDANCTNYSTCVSNCGTSNPTCVSSCQTSYPTGMSEAESLQSCICQTACSTSCSADTYCTTGL